MRNTDTFNPNRLKFARKRRGITIKALASAIGMTIKIVSIYENDKGVPPPQTLAAMARELHFPESFFFLEDIAELNDSAVSFRSFSKMTASVKGSALGAGQIALEFASWLYKKFDLPIVDLPDLREHQPEAAAAVLRNIWALGELPIGNMVHLLEAKGVMVFSLTENTLDMDAYSFWMNEHPFIFLNTKKTVERSRFDAAHELGHLVLHKHGSPAGKEVELEANRFASAFLMPSGSVRTKAPRFPTLDVFIKLKPHWKVSTAALIRRMKDLDLLTDWYYRNLMIELSKKYGRKNEPNAISQREASKLLPMVFKALREEEISKKDIADELCLFVNDLDALFFNLMIVGIDGGSRKDSSSLYSPPIPLPTNHLKRIK
jgi:Zn-dependent peptidase ImmA (M78 family)/DNA-binding XRE family transcriptional regulator